jgi:hypothetical protein
VTTTDEGQANGHCEEDIRQESVTEEGSTDEGSADD